MATIAKELHDGLVTVIDKLNTMVAILQKIEAEQQDCLYKLNVMAGIKLADAKPPPTPLPSLASTNLVQSLLETMDTMPTLHPDLQGISDEQQPMAMDGLSALHPNLQRIVDEQQPMSMLPAFHPDLQQVVDKQQATSSAAPHPAVQSELLLPPALPLSASTSAATACGTEPRPAAPPAAPTATTTAIRGPKLPPVQPSSALTVVAATYGPPPRPAPLPAPPTAGTTTFGGIENLPPPSCAPKAAILCTVSIPASSPTLGFVAATSSYKPTLFAWDPGVEGHTPTVPQPQRRVVVHIPQP
jgi:hypothetical protein